MTTNSLAEARNERVSAQPKAVSPPARAASRPWRLRFERWQVRLSLLLSTALCFAFIYLASTALREHGWSMLPFALMIGGLFYCALTYQLVRLGAVERKARPSPPAAAAAAFIGEAAPSVTVLIPSYQESRRVLIATALSAALATYRNKRIVVLLDDPPDRPGPLAESHRALADLKLWLAEAAQIRDRALASAADLSTYAAAHHQLADWLERIVDRLRAEADPAFVHVDRFVIDRLVRPLAAKHRSAAAELHTLAQSDPAADSELEGELARHRDWLAACVTTEITSFERKRFANLSHAANKAMNINTYLGLMGQDWQMVPSPSGQLLQAVGTAEAKDIPATERLSVPMSDYVLTLDADSVIVPEYILTLVGVLEASPKAAVAQTPYLTYPDGITPVERIAGATTDIQYLIHQGSSFFGAAYWVGANAILRRRALEDIKQVRIENGHPITVFVQDKTVIEDTGSTIDLMDKDWQVHNHFEPLAYSATPADFGALSIQRKRWANGGLILVVDLLRSHWRKGRFLRSLPQLLVRAHYLISPLIGNVGILALMLLPSVQSHPMFWAALFMLPYFLLYMSDLRRMGYRSADLFGVCALNLMLLPVNLAGILASIWQMVGGPRLKFLRTPKISSRTPVPAYAFLFNMAILGLMVSYVVTGLRLGDLQGVVIPSINVVLYSYGLWRFVGIGAGFADLGRSLLASLARPFSTPLLARKAAASVAAVAATGAPAAAVEAPAASLSLPFAALPSATLPLGAVSMTQSLQPTDAQERSLPSQTRPRRTYETPSRHRAPVTDSGRHALGQSG